MVSEVRALFPRTYLWLRGVFTKVAGGKQAGYQIQ